MTDHTTPVLVTTTEAGIVIVRCASELDLHGTPSLRDALLGPIRAGARGVVVDLTETTFCDSTVFSVLVEASRAAAAQNVPYAIAAGETAVARPLQILGLDRLLPLHPGLDAAQAAVAHRPAVPVADAGEAQSCSPA
ncbi:STAS domain-containing protein [Amycolatopsis sp. MtRt-6]|uniref:STAS domain-containing protein n=1 Tax=Amycolatopsis sp. MtRt-6 TaxID=2792782 RepID=UPI001A8EABF4|nr:STAS domain-containing protein [Amycolatopsis sp. MtRt-6]